MYNTMQNKRPHTPDHNHTIIKSSILVWDYSLTFNSELFQLPQVSHMLKKEGWSSEATDTKLSLPMYVLMFSSQKTNLQCPLHRYVILHSYFYSFTFNFAHRSSCLTQTPLNVTNLLFPHLQISHIHDPLFTGWCKSKKIMMIEIQHTFSRDEWS